MAAGKSSGGKRPGQRARGKKPKSLQAVKAARSGTEAEQLLDRLEEAMLARDQNRTQAALDSLLKVRRELPEILTRRLIEGRTQIPLFAFELLGSFGGPRTKTYLRRIAEDSRAIDIVRFGAQRRAGWPERGAAKRRLKFFESLKDPDGTLVEAIRQGSETWLPKSEVLEEVLGYLSAFPSERRQSLVSRAIEELGPQIFLLLHALLHLDDPATQRLALGELVRRREPGAVGAIGRLARTTPDPELKAEATAALQRFRLQVVDREQRFQPLALPPVERALVSAIDGDGGQMIIVQRALGEGAFAMATVFQNDHWGIKDAYGASLATDDQVEFMIEEFTDQEIGLVEVDLAVVRGTLAAGIEANAASGRGLPPAFEVWEILLHDSYPPPDDEPVTIPELDDGSYGGSGRDRNSDELVVHPFFIAWGFDPTATATALLATPPPSSGRLTDRQYRPVIEQLVDASQRARLRQRLRRQAWLLDHTGDTQARDLALATAAKLAGASPAELSKQPFLRALVNRSVLNAFMPEFLFC